jgi:hypothetical protein
MPESPWISSFDIEPEPEREYSLVITYLPLKNYFSLRQSLVHMKKKGRVGSIFSGGGRK